MQPVNCYYKCSKISEAKFRYLLPLFALDFTASDAAQLTGLSVRAVNEVYLRLRHRLVAWSSVPAEIGGAVELTESSFGPGACAASGTAARAAKPSSSTCSNAGPRYTPNHLRLLEKDLASHYTRQIGRGGNGQHR